MEYTSTQRIDVMQSYILTTARYDFNVYEKRILYRIVEMIQEQLSGKKLNQKYSINKTLFELYDITMPVSALLNGENDTHYERTKSALRAMTNKKVQYEDANEWREIPLIAFPKIRKFESTVHFKMHEDIYDVLMNFSKGYKKYELKTAFAFESVYAMRFYELFSGQRTPLNFSVENLKIMFGVENKYKKPNDFIRFVVEAAQKELNEKSPYSFDYQAMKTGRKITSIRFYPVKIPQNVNEDFEAQRLNKQLSPSWTIERQNLQYLKEHYKFSTPEIQNNIELFEYAQKQIPDLLYFMSEVKAKANRANNPKGYLINAMRKKLNIRTSNKMTAEERGKLKELKNAVKEATQMKKSEKIISEVELLP